MAIMHYQSSEFKWLGFTTIFDPCAVCEMEFCFSTTIDSVMVCLNTCQLRNFCKSHCLDVGGSVKVLRLRLVGAITRELGGVTRDLVGDLELVEGDLANVVVDFDQVQVEGDAPDVAISVVTLRLKLVLETMRVNGLELFQHTGHGIGYGGVGSGQVPVCPDLRIGFACGKHSSWSSFGCEFHGILQPFSPGFRPWVWYSETVRPNDRSIVVAVGKRLAKSFLAGGAVSWLCGCLALPFSW